MLSEDKINQPFQSGDWIIRFWSKPENLIDIIRIHKLVTLTVGLRTNSYIFFFEFYRMDVKTKEVTDQVIKTKSFIENIKESDIVMYHPDCVVPSYNDNLKTQLRKITPQEQKEFFPIIIMNRHKATMYTSMCKFIIEKSKNVDWSKRSDKTNNMDYVNNNFTNRGLWDDDFLDGYGWLNR